MNFVTIDFETANYSQDSACSVGLVKFKDGETVDSYYSLIRPPRLYIRRDFTKIHGLTVADVKDAPRFNEVWDSAILPFIGDFPLAAHNASFDMGVLRAVLKCYELPVPELQFFCTLQLSRRTWTDLKSHALTSLGRTFEIEYDAHNALDDAKTCGKLVLMAAEKFGCAGVEELLDKTGVKMGLLKSNA